MSKACNLPVADHYSGSRDNDVGVPYILQGKATGRALADYDWAEASREPPGYQLLWPLLPLFDQDRQKVMRQLGTNMLRLTEIRFEQIGSILEDSDGFPVGDCLSQSLAWQGGDSLEAGINRSTFSERQYLRALTQLSPLMPKRYP